MLNHRLIKFFIATLLLLSPVFHKTASADEAIPNKIQNSHISYCVSNAEINSVTEAQKCIFTKKHIQTRLSFVEKKRWFKIEAPNEPGINSFTLKIEPFLLDHVDVFYQSNDKWTSLTTGSGHKMAPGLTALGGFKLLVPASSANVSTYYVSVTAPELSYVHIKIDPHSDQFHTVKEDVNYELGIQIGILCAIVFFSIIILLIDTSWALARYTLFTLDLLLCTLLGSGAIMQIMLYSQPGLNQWLFHSAISLRLALWIWSTNPLIAAYKAPRWYDNFSRLTYIIIGFGITLTYLFNVSALIGMVSLLILFTPLIQTYVVYKMPNIPKIYRRILLLGFALSFLLLALMIASLIHPLEFNTKLPLHLAHITDITLPVILFSIISYQNRLNRTNLVKTTIELNQIKNKSSYESKLYEDRKILLDMLNHELKNSLTSINFALENIFHNQEKTGLISNINHINNIHRCVRDMDEIIDRCGLMSQIDIGEFQLSKSRVFLKKLVREIVLDKKSARRVDIRISSKLFLYSDDKFLRVVIRNLIQNAIRYSTEASKVIVIGENELNVTCIKIINQIDPLMEPNPKKLFTRFYRHPLAQKSRGAGLGLFITKKLCDLLGAKIEYERKEDVVCFSIKFTNFI